MTILNFIAKNRKTFIVGIFIIFFTLWNRILRQRIPKSISDFNNVYAIYGIYITIIVLITTILTMIFILYFPRKHSWSWENIFGIRIYIFISNLKSYVTESPKTLFEILYQMFNIAILLEKPFSNLSLLLRNANRYYMVIINYVFNTIPKIIPPIIFIIEIVITQRLEYFYNSLFLIIIVLLYNILLYLLSNLADKNTIFATAHIDVICFEEEYKIKFRSEIPDIEGAIDIRLRKQDKPLLEWFGYIYSTYADIKWLVYRLNQEKTKTKIFEIFFVTTLYLLGWLYILITIYNL